MIGNRSGKTLVVDTETNAPRKKRNGGCKLEEEV